MAVAASRLTLSPSHNGWYVDDAVALDEQWHGAGVVARADGQLVGILLIEGMERYIAHFPPDWSQSARAR